MSDTSYNNNKLLPRTSKDSRSIKPGYMIFNTGYIVSWDIIWHYDITPKPITAHLENPPLEMPIPGLP
jgi:hypothetical protein